MIVYLASAAFAQVPEVAAHATVALADGSAERASWVGAHGGVEWPIKRFAVGGRAMVGVLTPRRFADAPVAVSVQPTLRAWLTDPAVGGLSAVIGAGGHLEGSLQPILSGGLALDLARRGSLRPRVEGSYHWMPDQWRWSMSAGVVFGRTPEPVVEVEPEPVVETPQVVHDGLAWVPAPVCDWLEPEEMAERGAIAPLALLDQQGRRSMEQVQRDEAAAESADGSGESGSTTLRREGMTPGLIVAAWPGDEVLIDGTVAEADASGLVVAYPEPGPLDVVIRGAGREMVRELAVAEEHALWFGVPPPAPIRVRFPVAIATLTDEARAQIRDVVDNRGGWLFEIRGSHSPEGDPERNAVLAKQRSQAVLAELRALGLDESIVRLSDILDVVGSDAPPEELRAAVIYPREAP